ncbi:hypothetical protein H0X48_00600 [Candidatus Dependentiae bacterium]|nr:hypothetical protein [Candidatus Dependentiae bacterium]
MISKKIYILLILTFIGCNGLAVHQVPLSSYAENASGGKVDEKLEKRIKAILQSFKIKVIPHVRNISETMFDTDASSRCNALPKYGCYYVNEHFFSLLTDEELKASLAYTLYGSKATEVRLEHKSNITTAGWLAYAAILGGVWYKLSIKMPQLSKLSAFLYASAAGSVAFSGSRLFVENMTKNDRLYVDKLIVQKTKNPQALAGFLKKSGAYDPISFDNESMRSRIAALENSDYIF